MMSFVAKRARVVLVLVSLLVFATFSFQSALKGPTVNQQTPAHYVPEFVGSISAKEWGIFDTQTGVILRGSSETTQRPMASIVKLFTAAVVARDSLRDTPITIQAQDIAALGRAGRLTIGDFATPYTLLFPLILESSNDAAAAIERVLGTEFHKGITALIADAHLEHTVIVDGSGLSPQNVSTIHDLASFFSYLKRTTPHVVDISQLRVYLTNNAAYQNNNPGRTFDTFVGGKHGYTDEAGHTFLGAFSTDTGDREIGIVLLGSTDLTADISKLYAFGRELAGSGILETP